MIGHGSFDLVIFDCDGVLIDSEVLASRIDAEELTAIGYPISVEEAVIRFTGLPGGAMRTIIEADWGRALPANFEINLQQRIKEAYRRDLRPVSGIAELLQVLSVATCVASSSAPDKLRLGLELTGLYDRLAPHVFSTSMVARGKPAPDLFLFAARQMGVEAARCVVVEDSIPGIQAGVAAGMQVIGFTAGGHCVPDHGQRLLQAGAAIITSSARELTLLLSHSESRRAQVQDPCTGFKLSISNN